MKNEFLLIKDFKVGALCYTNIGYYFIPISSACKPNYVNIAIYGIMFGREKFKFHVAHGTFYMGDKIKEISYD